jgi:hypothetical protein
MSLFDTINAGGPSCSASRGRRCGRSCASSSCRLILLCVAYLILWERKLIGWMHVRLGPNRVGPAGLLQPIADVLKLLLKEVISRRSEPLAVPGRAGHDHHAGAGGLGGDPVRPRRCWPTSTPACCT